MIPNWKAPGPDDIHGYWLKNFRTLHQRMAGQLQHCINNHLAPEWMTIRRTARVQKNKSKGNLASNYRPIICLPIMWKLLTEASSVKGCTTIWKRQSPHLTNRKAVAGSAE